MKRNTKKGFTLVELVIVIAVIAILASVLIPTFSNVVSNAQEAAAKQQAANQFKEDYAVAMADDGIIEENETERFTSATLWEMEIDDVTYKYEFDTTEKVWKGPTKQ